MTSDEAEDTAGSATAETEPVPDVWPPPPQLPDPASAGPIYPEFRRQNILLTLVLVMITLGIYQLFWMWRQIKVINSKTKDYAVSVPAFVVCALFSVVDIIVGFAMDDHSGIVRLVDLVSAAMNLVILFSIRMGFNQSMGLRVGSRGYSGKVGTFFFGPMYLQFRINQYLKYATGL